MLQILDTSRPNEIDIERNSTGRRRSLSSTHVWTHNWHPLPRHTGQIGGVLCEILEKIHRDISGVHCIYRMAFHCLCELSLWLLLLILLYCESINELKWIELTRLKYMVHLLTNLCHTASMTRLLSISWLQFFVQLQIHIHIWWPPFIFTHHSIESNHFGLAKCNIRLIDCLACYLIFY